MVDSITVVTLNKSALPRTPIEHTARGKNMEPTFELLLWSQNPAHLHEWAEILHDFQVTIRDTANSPTAEPFDVLLLDETVNQKRAADFLAATKSAGQGLIGVGTSGEFDVQLPAAPPASELHLACRLLCEIVHLRRLQQSQLQDRATWEDLAMSDHLTKLANRRAWDQALENWDGGLLVILDIDHFKKVNEQRGHAAGDQLLQQVAAALRKNIRDHDFLARLGGDEFGLLLDGPRTAEASQVVDRIRSSLGKIVDPPITASAGFTRATRGDPPEHLQAVADQALRQAKAAGRDRTREG